MKRFLKANIASCLATLLDFGMMALLHQGFKLDVVISSVVASICGGVLHFMLSRTFVFQAYNEKPTKQAVRYMIIWIGNIFFNALGVYVLAEKSGVHYLLSKVISSFLVFVIFNYPMHKKFVFKTVR